MSDEIYKQKFINRVQKHINRVNQFAQKLGLSYPNHDNDKLSSPLLDMYYLDKKSDYVDLTDKEEKKLLKAGMQHRLNSPHHPEYWDKGNIENMTGIRDNPKKLFNVQNMPLEAVTEMCCDWCAMSKEFGNTPFEWYNHIKGRRYNFSKEQEDYILKTLKKLWYGKQNNQIEKITESWTDSYDLYDIYENYQPYNVLMEFENGEQNIWFPLIKPTEYKQALLEFMKMGELVRFPKDKVFKWLEIIMKNTCIIDAMTALAGHTAWFPYDDCRNVYDELEDAESDYYIFSEFLDERGFYDWCKLPDGSDAWSDYGLQPLWDILDEYQENMTAEQVLVLVNRCLDVTHQRGDLPSAFIEGGSSSLTKISNESVERKINEEYEGLNRIAGFYWFDRHNWLEDGHFQLLKRKPVGVEELDPEDDEFDYYHLDDNGLEEDNKARFGIQKMGKKVVCYIESENKQKCLKAKKAIQKRFNNILIDKFQLSWGRGGFEELNESIAYAESNNDDLVNVILKNPTRKELKRYNVDRWRLLQDIDGNYYFANAFKYTHDMMSNKLRSNGIRAVDANTDNCGITLYNTLTNTFYYRLLGIIDYEDVEAEYKSSYLSKEFPNADLEQMYDDREELNESIAYVSKKDLSDIILMNPTKRELRENNLTLCRCIEDSEGNWYFADMENMLQAYIVSELRDEAYFPLFDGNDCYGIAYYDAESNEFWYNLNDYMYKKECIEQYNNSEYLRTTFPNARIISNPWNNQVYDELYESIVYASKSDLSDVVLINPTRKELKDNNIELARYCYDVEGNFYFGNANILTHNDIILSIENELGITLYDDMGFYDVNNNCFYIRGYFADEDEYNKELENAKINFSSESLLKDLFGNFKVDVFQGETPWD